MQVWPAIDIRNGKCVRLSHGDRQLETVYGSSPADMALRWVSDGAEGIHILDLDGARDGACVNQTAISDIVREIDVPIQIGGGIRDIKSIDRLLEMGIKRWVISTCEIENARWVPELIERYPDQVLIGIDSLDGFAAAKGWLKTVGISAIEFAKQITDYPVAGIIYTDVSRDGMLSGSDFEAIEKINETADVPVIASGGISSIDEIARLAALGLAGCIVGRALYEGRLILDEAINAAGSGVSTS